MLSDMEIKISQLNRIMRNCPNALKKMALNNASGLSLNLRKAVKTCRNFSPMEKNLIFSK